MKEGNEKKRAVEKDSEMGPCERMKRFFERYQDLAHFLLLIVLGACLCAG